MDNRLWKIKCHVKVIRILGGGTYINITVIDHSYKSICFSDIILAEGQNGTIKSTLY